MAVQVVQVVSGGPAEKAGIRSGDIIYKMDDRSVGTVDDMRRYLERLADGTRVRVSLIRVGQNGPQAAEANVTVRRSAQK